MCCCFLQRVIAQPTSVGSSGTTTGGSVVMTQLRGAWRRADGGLEAIRGNLVAYACVSLRIPDMCMICIIHKTTDILKGPRER